MAQYSYDTSKALKILDKFSFTRAVQRWICIVCTEGVEQIPVDVLSYCTTSLSLFCHAFLCNSIVPVKM